MTKFRTRPLGHGWSITAAPDDAGSREEQLLALFVRALETVPELSRLPRGLDPYDVRWVGSGVAIYHPDVDFPVFRAEFVAVDGPGQVGHVR